jgi:hypothetical protein
MLFVSSIIYLKISDAVKPAPPEFTCLFEKIYPAPQQVFMNFLVALLMVVTSALSVVGLLTSHAPLQLASILWRAVLERFTGNLERPVTE